jgi:hypothetical protein
MKPILFDSVSKVLFISMTLYWREYVLRLIFFLTFLRDVSFPLATPCKITKSRRAENNSRASISIETAISPQSEELRVIAVEVDTSLTCDFFLSLALFHQRFTLFHQSRSRRHERQENEAGS